VESVKKKRSGQTADRFIAETVALIEERGSSQDVTLREIAERVGCAHTNVYNYFEDFDDLLWAAFSRAIDIYFVHLAEGLPLEAPARELLQTFMERVVSFPREHTGLYRFITTDRLEIEAMPQELLESIARLRLGYRSIVTLAAGLPAGSDEGVSIADILLAYVEGESLSEINERVLPGDDVSSRIVDNTMRLFALLVMEAHSNADTPLPDPTRVIQLPALLLDTEP
jgi:AcrR family transcriptional regulator